jgi:hypothetical protein
MKPDELVQVDKIVGAHSIVSEETGESIAVSCDLRLFRHMLWCGDGFQRTEGGLSIEGTVWKQGDRFWARRQLGKQFLLTSGNRKVHFFIKDSEGSIANTGQSDWKV